MHKLWFHLHTPPKTSTPDRVHTLCLTSTIWQYALSKQAYLDAGALGHTEPQFREPFLVSMCRGGAVGVPLVPLITSCWQAGHRTFAATLHLRDTQAAATAHPDAAMAVLNRLRGQQFTQLQLLVTSRGSGLSKRAKVICGPAAGRSSTSGRGAVRARTAASVAFNINSARQ